MFGSLVQIALPIGVLLAVAARIWVPMAFAIVALVERVATMPVRIAQKREQELLKRAMARRQIHVVNEGLADVQLALALYEDPLRRQSPNERGSTRPTIQTTKPRRQPAHSEDSSGPADRSAR
jgi:hypothetical protein